MSDVTLLLDCTDLERTLSSLSAALDVSPVTLSRVIRAYDDQSRPPGEDSWMFMPQTVVRSLGADLDAVRFDGAVWFHGTRTLEPDRFLHVGLLPLQEIVEWLWVKLFALCGGEVSESDWLAFRHRVEAGMAGHGSYLYRLKMGQPSDQGPLGVLVRATLMVSEPGIHDYLATPEIVADILGEASRCFGVDLVGRYSESAKPCIVSFRTTDAPDPGAIATALVYAHGQLAGDGVLGFGASHAHSAQGKPIPADRILGVEVITGRS